MIDVESRLARLKMDDGRELNHGLARRADRGAGRGAAVADVRQRVGLRIARRVVGAGECHRSRLGSHNRPSRQIALRRTAWIFSRDADIDVIEDRRILPIARLDFHHDMILVDRAVAR